MKLKTFTIIALCLFLKTGEGVSSQNSNPSESPGIIRLKAIEAENKILTHQIKINEKEIRDLRLKLATVKNSAEKKRPIYKRLLKRKSKPGKTEIVTAPVPVIRADTSMTIPDSIKVTLPPMVPAIKKKERFFKRIFKIFNNNKKKHS